MEMNEEIYKPTNEGISEGGNVARELDGIVSEEDWGLYV